MVRLSFGHAGPACRTAAHPARRRRRVLRRRGAPRRPRGRGQGAACSSSAAQRAAAAWSARRRTRRGSSAFARRCRSRARCGSARTRCACRCPRHACSLKHREIRAVLERFTPHVQAASIDEWYLDLAGTERLYDGASLDDDRASDPDERHRRNGNDRLDRRRHVEADREARRGARQAEARHRGERRAHRRAGRRARLHAPAHARRHPGDRPEDDGAPRRRGLRTVEDVLALDAAALARLVGERDAAWLRSACAASTTARSRIARSRRASVATRPSTRTSTTTCSSRASSTELVGRAAADLRGDGLTARTVTVRIRDTDFTTRQASRTRRTRRWPRTARSSRSRASCWRSCGARGACRRDCSVSRSRTSPSRHAVQLALFEKSTAPLETPRDREVSRAVDAVRAASGATRSRQAESRGRASYSSSTRSAPFSTAVPGCASTAFTVAAAVARSSFSIFIASITTSPWPGCTTSPTWTLHANDHPRHRGERAAPVPPGPPLAPASSRIARMRSSSASTSWRKPSTQSV